MIETNIRDAFNSIEELIDWAEFKLKKYGNEEYIARTDSWTLECLNVDFPPLIINNVRIEMNDEQKKFYQQVRFSPDFDKILKNEDFTSRQLVLRCFNLHNTWCQISLQFIIRNKNLYCMMNLRSSDIKKLEDDIKIAKLLSDIVYKEYSKKIELKRIIICTHAASFHKYINHILTASNILNECCDVSNLSHSIKNPYIKHYLDDDNRYLCIKACSVTKSKIDNFNTTCKNCLKILAKRCVNARNCRY